MKRLTKEQIRELPLFMGLDSSNIYVVEKDIDATKATMELKKNTRALGEGWHVISAPSVSMCRVK